MTLPDDVTLLYIQCSCGGFLPVQQLVTHSYWMSDDEGRLPFTAGVITVYTSGFLPLLLVCVFTHIKNPEDFKACLITSLSNLFSSVFHKWSWDAAAVLSPFLSSQKCGDNGCDAIQAPTEMLWCDRLLFICLSPETRALICKYKDILLTYIWQGTMSMLVVMQRKEKHVCMPCRH